MPRARIYTASIPAFSLLLLLLIGLATAPTAYATASPRLAARVAEGIFFTANPTAFTNSARRIDLAGGNESILLGPVPMFELHYYAGDGKFYGPSYDGAIRRMDPDGSNVETLLDGLDDPNTLHLDTDNGKMYWFDQGRLQVYGLEIRRANLDGSDMETVIPDDAGLGEMGSLTIDLTSGKLYVVDGDENIRRANLDGTALETVFTPTEGVNPEMSCITVDATNGKFYWVHDGGSSGNYIGRADLDGSNPESLIPLVTFPSVSCLTLDLDEGSVYWGDRKPTVGVIRRADLDGSNISDVVVGQRGPGKVILGPDDKLYWLDRATVGFAPILMRAGRDGSNPETVAEGFTLVRAMTVIGAESGIFWIDQGARVTEMGRADLDGNNSQTLMQSLRDLRAIAVDRGRDHLYLSNGGDIIRTTVGSTSFEVLVTVTTTVNSLALDLVNDKIYWVSGSGGRDGTVSRANLDGSAVEDLYVVPGNDIQSILGVALDVAGNRLFWSYQVRNSVGSIWQAELDGTDPAPLVTNLGFPRGLGVDVAGGKVYWVDSSSDKVQRADLDGENVEDLVVSGLSQPYGLVVDSANNYLYWSDTETGIRRAELDGSGVVTLYDGPASPFILAVVADAPDGDASQFLYLPMTSR